MTQPSAEQPAGRPDLSDRRILTLDDDQNMRSIVCGVLAQCNCREVLQASTGPKALELFEAEPIDLVVCDWAMEPMNGFVFLTELRKLDKGVRTPVIMLTANSEPADALSAQHLNIAAWLVKPISANALLERIGTALRLPSQQFSIEHDLNIDLTELTDQYRSKLSNELRDLERLVARFRHHHRTHIDRNWLSMIRLFHSIKGQAGAFGYDLITSLAATGQSLLRDAKMNVEVIVKFQSHLYGALAALVTAMSLVFQSDIKGVGGNVGNRLLAKIDEVVEPLRRMIEAELKHANKS